MEERTGSWRRLRVARRVRESENVVSLHLVAADGAPLPPWIAGQFLTFRIPTASGRPAPRTYSLSGDPADVANYRISVKREEPPAADPMAPPGVGSAFLHDVALEGVILDALPPRGDFVLDPASSRPTLLLAGGIGITPLAAMARSLARAGRPTWLFHACESARVLPLGDEMRALARATSTLRVFHGFMRIEAAAGALTRPDFIGFLTADVLKSHVPIGNYDACLCGPAAFMQAMFDLLLDLGVREERIRYEFFGTARKLQPSSTEPDSAVAQTEAMGHDCRMPIEGGLRVTFSRTGKSALWGQGFRSLLEFAEAQGLTPPFSCRSGICATCQCGLQGEVNYIEDPLEKPPPGQVLICCSVPRGAVTLDI